MIIIWTSTAGCRGMCSRKTSIRQFGNDSPDYGKRLNPQNLELFPQNLGNLTQNLWKRFPASPKRCLETFSKNRFPESLERFFDDMYHLETIPKTCFENVSKHCFWRLWHLQKRCQTHTQYNNEHAFFYWRVHIYVQAQAHCKHEHMFWLMNSFRHTNTLFEVWKLFVWHVRNFFFDTCIHVFYTTSDILCALSGLLCTTSDILRSTSDRICTA